MRRELESSQGGVSVTAQCPEVVRLYSEMCNAICFHAINNKEVHGMKNRRVQGAADYCGVSKSYLDKLRLTGGGPAFIRLGRAVVYNDADLDAWIQDRRVAVNDNRSARTAA